MVESLKLLVKGVSKAVRGESEVSYVYFLKLDFFTGISILSLRFLFNCRDETLPCDETEGELLLSNSGDFNRAEFIFSYS